MNTTDAKKVIVDAAEGKGDNTLDEAADELIKRIGQFFGECVGGDTFCGLAIDETRDENGLLLSLRLVACDLINDEPARRVAR